ncbi:MAG: hypothetical protein EOO03_04270 [Chitinophagaceae bacterium]|nr:MAG: hypothetical protein EOO03_04270 [Chitinophagaceae bacterium]
MKLLRFVLPAMCMALSMNAISQNNFMKIMDPNQINGESRTTGFINWTEIMAFNGGSGFEIIMGGGGSAPGKAETKCFTVSLIQDKTTYWLKKEMYTGSSMTSVQFDFTKVTNQATKQTYYRLYMEDVMVSNIEEAVDEGGQSIINVSFVPAKFRYSYWAQLPNGSLEPTPVVFGWDVMANKIW